MNTSLRLLSVLSLLVTAACSNQSETQSHTDAYGAPATETHLVVAAPLYSSADQRLWVCKGNAVETGTRPEGYPVSIGVGAGQYTDVDLQTPTNRNRGGSNLTPLGEMRISRKIDSTCGEGMLTRCMQLHGVEYGVNDRTINRSIYIHGTPSANYSRLGRSASHGCVRMNQRDVIKIYDRTKVGTRVFINSKAVHAGNPCMFTGKGDNFKAR